MLKQSILADFKKNLSILKIDNHSLKGGKNTVLSEKANVKQCGKTQLFYWQERFWDEWQSLKT